VSDPDRRHVHAVLGEAQRLGLAAQHIDHGASVTPPSARNRREGDRSLPGSPRGAYGRRGVPSSAPGQHSRSEPSLPSPRDRHPKVGRRRSESANDALSGDLPPRRQTTAGRGLTDGTPIEPQKGSSRLGVNLTAIPCHASLDPVRAPEDGRCSGGPPNAASRPACGDDLPGRGGAWPFA
jgi:hypothetical protein